MRICAMMAAGAMCATAGATVVNFDDVTVPYVNVVNNVYSYQLRMSQGAYDEIGLWFRTAPTDGCRLYWGTSPATDTPPNFVYASNYYGLIANSPIYVDFIDPDSNPEELFVWQPAQRVEFFLHDLTDAQNTAGVWHAEIHDINGQVIESRSGTESNVWVSFSRPTADIYTVVLFPSADCEGMDSLRIDEPPAQCAADYDNNGGVDGGDLAAFFTDFEQGLANADVDQNGGVDGGDLAYFFAVFEAGGC